MAAMRPERLDKAFCHPFPFFENASESAVVRRLMHKQVKAKDIVVLTKDEQEELSSWQSQARPGLPPSLFKAELPEGLGAGIFLGKEADPIPSNTFLAAYGGTVHLIYQNGDSTEEEDSYTVTLLSGIEGISAADARACDLSDYDPSDKDSLSIVCDGSEVGNWTRFMNHASVGFANVKPVLAWIDLPKGQGRVLAYVFKTIKEIRPGTQLMWDYGPEFWKSPARRSLLKACAPGTFQLDEAGAVRCPRAEAAEAARAAAVKAAKLAKAAAEKERREGQRKLLRVKKMLGDAHERRSPRVGKRTKLTRDFLTYG